MSTERRNAQHLLFKHRIFEKSMSNRLWVGELTKCRLLLFHFFLRSISNDWRQDYWYALDDDLPDGWVVVGTIEEMIRAPTFLDPTMTNVDTKMKITIKLIKNMKEAQMSLI